MIMIRAIIRPEKVNDVLAALMVAGFPAVTKMDVSGRGKQRGMKVGEITYDELPKELIFTVVPVTDKDIVVAELSTFCLNVHAAENSCCLADVS